MASFFTHPRVGLGRLARALTRSRASAWAAAWAFACLAPLGVAEAVPAEHLHCEIRYASQRWHLDALPTAQPLRAPVHQVGQRFAFRAIVRSDPEDAGRIAHVATQVFDLESDQEPMVQ